MPCPKCVDVLERPDVPHVVRTCEGCGRTLRVHEPGAHGKGLQVKKGDQVVIPADWLRLSLNPLKTNAQFSRFGLQWFAEQSHLEDLPRKRDEVPAELDRIQKRCDDILEKSALLQGLDLERPEDGEKAIDILKANRDTKEWWAFL